MRWYQFIKKSKQVSNRVGSTKLFANNLYAVNKCWNLITFWNSLLQYHCTKSNQSINLPKRTTQSINLPKKKKTRNDINDPIIICIKLHSQLMANGYSEFGYQASKSSKSVGFKQIRCFCPYVLKWHLMFQVFKVPVMTLSCLVE